jgi:hypothetical protein
LRKIVNPLGNAVKEPKTTANSRMMVRLVVVPSIVLFLFLLLLVSPTISLQSVNAQQNAATTITN